MFDGLRETAGEWLARAAEIADLVIEIGQLVAQLLPALLGS